MKKIGVWKIIFIIISLLVIINNVYLLINIKGLHSIENTLRLVGSIIIALLTLLMVFLNIKASLKNKLVFKIIMIIINIIMIGAIGFVNINFNIIYDKLHKVTTNYTTYSISLVTTIDNDVENIKSINDDIGVIDDREIANGYTFAYTILIQNNMSNTLKEYNNYITIIDDLLNGEIKYAFLPSNYVEVFASMEGYERLNEKLKTIHTVTKKEEQELSAKNVNEPFTILLMGVDGVGDDISRMTANGDSLILVTFNPNTFNVTMLSIPRDSYVPISCMDNKKNKITHSSWGGETCIIKTIQNLTGIKIDYYIKVNFNGVVKLVDTLGGIDVDVEYSFCEQNSQRLFGEHTIYLEKGFQTINGEQALAYARNRHPNPGYCSSEWTNYTSNDFVRSAHQQDIIKAILTKVKNIRDLNTLYSLLDTISNNMETNMTMNTILSFYNVAKDLASKFNANSKIEDIINIERLYLNGYGAMIYDHSQFAKNAGSRLVLWDYVLYKGSINDVVNAMKINLGYNDVEAIKTFNYDITKPYTKEIIGKKYYSEKSIELLPDFVGKSKEEATKYANAHGLKLTIEYVSESNFEPGQVVSQDPGYKMDISEMSDTKGLKITVMEGTKKFDYSNCLEEDYKDNKNCQFVDYTNKNYTEFETWLNTYSAIKKNVTYNIIDENSEEYSPLKAGIIKSITINDIPISKLSIYEAKNSKIIVTYYALKKEEEKPSTDTSSEDNTTDNQNNDGD